MNSQSNYNQLRGPLIDPYKLESLDMKSMQMAADNQAQSRRDSLFASLNVPEALSESNKQMMMSYLLNEDRKS